MPRPRAFDEDEVLDAVMDTFWRHGFHGTSAQHLVDATGLGRGSLYNAYASKEALFERALQRYAARTLDDVEALKGPGPIRDRIRTLLTSVFETRSGRSGCLATNTAIEARDDDRIAALAHWHFRTLEAGLEQAIRSAQENGEISPTGDPHVLAGLVLTMLQGLRVVACAAPPDERSGLAAIIERVLRILD